MMKAQIEQALKELIGLPLRDAGRAGLEWFSFGDVYVIPDHKGGTREVGDWALHVQCAWRLAGPEGIIVASGDRFYPAGDDPHTKDLDDFDTDRQGANRCDERMAMFFRVLDGNLPIVEKVWGDEVGSIRLMLSRGYALEVFPHYSFEGENWRLFRPGTDAPHFVVMRSGIEN